MWWGQRAKPRVLTGFGVVESEVPMVGGPLLSILLLFLLLQGPPAHHHQNLLQLPWKGQRRLWARRVVVRGNGDYSVPAPRAPTLRQVMALTFGGRCGSTCASCWCMFMGRGELWCVCTHVCAHACGDSGRAQNGGGIPPPCALAVRTALPPQPPRASQMCSCTRLWDRSRHCSSAHTHGSPVSGIPALLGQHTQLGWPCP